MRKDAGQCPRDDISSDIEAENKYIACLRYLSVGSRGPYRSDCIREVPAHVPLLIPI